MSEKESWHLDRRVPVAIIVTIMIQLLGGAWVASQLVSRLENVEKTALNNRHSVEKMEERQRLSETAYARLEERMNAAIKILEKIDRKIND